MNPSFREFQCQLDGCKFTGPDGEVFLEHLTSGHGIAPAAAARYPVRMAEHLDGTGYSRTVLHVREPVAAGQPFTAGKLIAIIVRQEPRPPLIRGEIEED